MSTILKLDAVSAGYSGKIIIENFNLTVSRGDHILLLGPNGAGKTTLFRVILGVLKPMKGSIEFPEGRSVAYSRQDPSSSPFPISVEEVVAMGTWKKKDTSIDDALSLTGALHLKNRLFHSLSGGERQRVTLARCLAQNAELILLDEPSSFLDKESRDSFLSLMEKVATENRAIIAITHDEEVVRRLGWKTIEMERRV